MDICTFESWIGRGLFTVYCKQNILVVSSVMVSCFSFTETRYPPPQEPEEEDKEQERGQG